MPMEDFPNMTCGWSWEENKLFELALAVVDEQDPKRWEAVAAIVGGKKSSEDVHKHYLVLLEDLELIESGELDYKLEGDEDSQNLFQPVCRTDEDSMYKLFPFQSPSQA